MAGPAASLGNLAAEAENAVYVCATIQPLSIGMK